jgi:hypothetical protein
VTTPSEQGIRILDAATLAQKAKRTFPGNTEGYAVDAKRGRFYTNLEDKDRTSQSISEIVGVDDPDLDGGWWRDLDHGRGHQPLVLRAN